MASGDESVYTADAASSDDDYATGSTNSRKRQMSMLECIQRKEGRKPKRNVAAQQSPEEAPTAKRRATRQSPTPATETQELLSKIEVMINNATGKVITAFNAKFEALERRIGILEGENFIKDQEMEQLRVKLAAEKDKVSKLEEQVESIDMNRRLSCLILTCNDFRKKRENENIVEMAVKVLNERIAGLDLTEADLSTAHRLQADDKVIAKFVRRETRDRVYDSRFTLIQQSSEQRRAGGSRLFINESLSTKNNEIFQELLRAKKEENGGIIASVFTRRGTVWCQRQKKGTNIRVADESDLVRVLDGRRFSSQSRPQRYLREQPHSARGGFAQDRLRTRVAFSTTASAPPAGAQAPSQRTRGSGDNLSNPGVIPPAPRTESATHGAGVDDPVMLLPGGQILTQHGDIQEISPAAGLAGGVAPGAAARSPLPSSRPAPPAGAAWRGETNT